MSHRFTTTHSNPTGRSLFSTGHLIRLTLLWRVATTARWIGPVLRAGLEFTAPAGCILHPVNVVGLVEVGSTAGIEPPGRVSAP